MNNLANKKVIVTGGAGMIGSHISRKLVNLKANVTVLDNLSFGKLDNIKDIFHKIEFIQGDIRDFKLVNKVFKDADYVSHQAALRSVPESIKNPIPYHEVNITGHLNVLEAARLNNIKCVTFASSSSVYGDSDKFPQLESQLPKPISPYALTKLTGEHYCRMYHELYGLNAVSLRYFNVFGQRQEMSSQYAVVIPKFINMMLNDEQPTIFGDGKQSRDFTFVENNVMANLLAFTTKKPIGGKVINICDGKGITVNQIVSMLNKIMNKDIEPIYLPKRTGDVLHTKGCPDKARRLLDYKTFVPFEEGLKRTVEWFTPKSQQKIK